MRKKALSVLLSIAVLMQLVVPCFATGDATVTMQEFKVLSRLETVKTEEGYGTTEEVTYTNEPSADNQYVLVSLNALIAAGQSVDLDNISISYGGTAYGRILADSFLTNHNYAQINHGIAIIGTSGWCIFEIPTGITEDQLIVGGSLSVDGIALPFGNADDDDNDDKNVITPESYDGYISRQSELESRYLATAKAGDYTAENPYIVVNPYEIAPQAAFMIFETETPVSVTTVIDGKGTGLAYELSTITNTISEAKTWHEIPLIGLYAGDNTVTVKLSDGSEFTHTITTENTISTKPGMTDLDVVTTDYEKLSNGLYVLMDNGRTLLDANGDIRGYFTLNVKNSGLDEVTADGHIFTALNAYTPFPTAFELDYMGYMYRQIEISGYVADHDAYLMDDDTLLLMNQEISFADGTMTKFARDWSEIFNNTQGSFEVRNDDVGYLHQNTIGYCGDGSIIVSMRNQHAIAKLTYPELDVQWVLSVNQEACLQDQDKYLRPVGSDFEWFYSQHHAQFVGENPDGTIDITVFDNGMHRGLDVDANYPAEDMYSRMVRYRIDETAMTVEQVWDWGQELGTAGLSYVHGSTQYIPASNTYLGNFDALSHHQSGNVSLPRNAVIIAEVSENDDVVLEWHLSDWNKQNGEGSYRIEKVATNTLTSSWQGLNTKAAEYLYVSQNLLPFSATTEATPATYQIHSISATDNYLNVAGWVGITGSLGTVLESRHLILTNQTTNEQYHYYLHNDTAQVKTADVPSSVKDLLNETAGFKHSFLDIRDLQDGYYTVSLLASASDKHYEVETDYTLLIGDAPTVVGQGEYNGFAERQSQLSAIYAAEMEKQVYTPKTPYIIVNPYEIAPQSALVIFETDTPVSVTTSILGKGTGKALELTTIENTITEENTHHEIPLIGLYAGVNTVTLTLSDGRTFNYTIETDGLSEKENGVHTVDVVTQDLDALSEGLYFLNDWSRTLVDVNGDIRGYFTIPICNTGADEVTKDGHIFGSLYSYTTYSTVYELDYLGFMYREYQIPGVLSDHDAYLLDDDTFLLQTHEIDLKNGTISEFAAPWSSVFNTMGSFEVRTYGQKDYFHQNTITDGGSDANGQEYILVSMRNQHAVAKFSYPQLELQWVLSDNREACVNDQDRYLTPIDSSGAPITDLVAAHDDFEWFYSQHHVSMVSQNDDGTMDITIFDNGMHRGVGPCENPEEVYPQDEMYSRMVRYRIDEENMTVQQVWDWGEDQGTPFLAYVHGSTQYVPESDTYVGNFDTFVDVGCSNVQLPREHMIMVEVSAATKNPVLEIHMDSAVYRTEKVPAAQLYPTWQGVGVVEGEYVYCGNELSEAEDVQFEQTPANYQIHAIEATQYYVNVKGWVAIDGSENKPVQERKMILTNRSTGKAYQYDLSVDTAQTKASAVPSDLKGKIHADAGFRQDLVNISDLTTGEYLVSLVAVSGDKAYVADTDYILDVTGLDPEIVLDFVKVDDKLEMQALVDSQLLARYEAGNFTLENPMVTKDPYNISPLSAIAMFATEKPANITITVDGLDGGKTITNQFDEFTIDHTIPVYGLYAERSTNVTLTATYGDGTSDSHTFDLAGGSLPALLDRMHVDYLAEGAADDLIFCQPPNRVAVPYAFDNNDDIRWVLSDHEFAAASVMLQLENGHFLVNSDKTMQSIYAESLVEMDYTGKIYKEYMLNNVHHDCAVLPNGNILADCGDYDNHTVEDAIFELDGETGEIVRYWDLTSYFPVGNRNEDGELIADANYGAGTHDWLHVNSIEYRESDNSMVLSGRVQDAIIKIDLDTGKLAWILSDPNDLWPDALEDKLLTPTGDLTNFEYQYGQHNVTWLPDGSGNLMVFDNGNYRSKTPEGILPVEDGYSRVAVYSIDEDAGTVEHVWQYGKELGRDYLSSFISSAQWLGDNHYFMDFGGGQTDANGDHQYNGGPNREAQIVEWNNGEVVFKASNTSIGITAGTYQALRLNIYNNATELDLTQDGVRLSSTFKTNYVEESTLNVDNAPTFELDAYTLVDNGAQLELTAALTDVVADDTMYLYMVGDETYRFPLAAKSTIQAKLNRTELPVGEYHLYITKNNAVCDLKQIWNIDTIPCPPPVCYDISVINSNPEAGWTSLGGKYSANTALTVEAKATDGYEFAGWQKDGRTVSTDAEYTFIPTADATLTAIFESEEDDTPSGGSTGGSSSGGGSFVTTTYTVETSYDGKGTITPDADELFEGQSETFYFEAAEGYEITDVLVNGKSVGAVDEYTVEDIDDDIIIEVIFSEIEATPLAFVDVVEGAYYYDAVRWAVENGVTSGTTDTTFSPDTVCTRAQAVTFLWKAAGSPVMDSEMTFTDVAKGAWYYDAVLWAVTNGITDGTGDGSTFSPDMTCDRSQIITFIWRSEGEPVVNYLMDYTDVPADTWYTEAVRWAVSKGITDGTSDTTFSPALDCTRGQIVTFMYRNH